MDLRLLLLVLALGLSTSCAYGQQAETKRSDGVAAPASTAPKPLASKYVGRWEIRKSPFSDSNRNSLTVDSQSETEAKGRFTSYRGSSNQPSMAAGDAGCEFRNAPFVMRRHGDARITMVVTHRKAQCGSRTYEFNVEPSGRLVHTSADGSFSAYFDPGKEEAPFAPAVEKGSNASSKARLQELDQLRRDGVITPEEYEAKRKEILSAL